jgi:Tfp pilus assembly protein PilO
MEDPMAVPGMWFAFGMTVLFTIIIVVVIWQLFATRRAHAAITRDEAYKKLVEEATKAQQQTAHDLEDLKMKVANIERMLKEVE